jgi:hypothetical protein
MRVLDLILRRRESAVSKDEAREFWGLHPSRRGLRPLLRMRG